MDRRFRTEAVNAPLVGQVACGEPIEAYENIEGSFVLPAELYGRGELMLLKADGESMKNVGIDDGDYIVIRKQDTAEYGDMVLAIIGTGGTVKTFYPQEDGTIILHPENEHYKDIIVEECLIQGVVVGCMKRYRNDIDKERQAPSVIYKESTKEKFLIVRSSRPCENKYLNLTFM